MYIRINNFRGSNLELNINNYLVIYGDNETNKSSICRLINKIINIINESKNELNKFKYNSLEIKIKKFLNFNNIKLNQYEISDILHSITKYTKYNEIYRAISNYIFIEELNSEDVQILIEDITNINEINDFKYIKNRLDKDLDEICEIYVFNNNIRLDLKVDYQDIRINEYIINNNINSCLLNNISMENIIKDILNREDKSNLIDDYLFNDVYYKTNKDILLDYTNRLIIYDKYIDKEYEFNNLSIFEKLKITINEILRYQKFNETIIIIDEIFDLLSNNSKTDFIEYIKFLTKSKSNYKFIITSVNDSYYIEESIKLKKE